MKILGTHKLQFYCGKFLNQNHFAKKAAMETQWLTPKDSSSKKDQNAKCTLCQIDVLRSWMSFWLWANEENFRVCIQQKSTTSSTNNWLTFPLRTFIWLLNLFSALFCVSVVLLCRRAETDRLTDWLLNPFWRYRQENWPNLNHLISDSLHTGDPTAATNNLSPTLKGLSWRVEDIRHTRLFPSAPPDTFDIRPCGLVTGLWFPSLKRHDDQKR